MKKILVIGLLLMFSLTFVSAYNFVGEEVILNCPGTQDVSDIDFSDGYGEYVYCTYSLDTNQESQAMFGMFPLALGGDNAGENPYEQIAYCGACDIEGNGYVYNLTEGTTTWTSVISKITTTYDEQTMSWVLGEMSILETHEQVFQTIPEPDETFIQQLMEALLGIICGVHQFGFCAS